jgi:glutamyl-tRNA synthetase
MRGDPMSVRVRFAPSPTGYLHIGGARTALYNYLYAKAKGGTFILRVEDTDLERSKSEFEKVQIEDLKWLGIIHDEGPDVGGPYGPYRQSERLDIYQKYALELVQSGKAYYDFCTEEEIEEMKSKALAEGRDPHYEGKWRDPKFKEEAQKRIAAGEKAAIRFRSPQKIYKFKDGVKGDVEYPANMVGDFVIIRSNGLPVYNYCCVVDDMLMKITHVIRAEEHLNNTVRQLIIYEALGVKPPEFAHVSLLIGEDRQKLSKRHGATSVKLYRDEDYLPEAMNNYLTLLGWSHPQEVDIFNKEDIISVFDINRFSNHSAIYDLVKLKWVNGQHLRKLSNADFIKMLSEKTPKDHFFFKQNSGWQNSSVDLFKPKIEFIHEFIPMLEKELLSGTVEKTDVLKEILAWETTPKIINYLKQQLKNVSKEFVTEAELTAWQESIKKDLSVKGKPLFMGVRAALTGHDHGPDLKFLIPLTPVKVLNERLAQL